MGVASDTDILARAIRNPGRLVLGATTTSGAFPYGGVSLGQISDAELEFDTRYYENRDPASGMVSEVARRSVDSLRLVCLIEGSAWDEDALANIFTKTSLGAKLPLETRIEGTVIPAVVQAWPSILLAALDPAHKSVYIRRPVQRLSLRQSVRLSLAFECGLPVVFSPTPDLAWATTPTWQVARLENITL